RLASPAPPSSARSSLTCPAPSNPPPLSFPTRRSSDLAFVPAPVGLRLQFPPPALFTTPPASFTSVPPLKYQMYALALAVVQFSGSEVHTSELRSREILVCRLLLEKHNATLVPPLARPE